MRKKRSKSIHQPALPGISEAQVPIVAIIGRPNVGKSTFFNRVLGTRSAIVDDMPGVTRDRITAECTYQGRRLQLVDTGGLDLSTSESMGQLIRVQSQTAIAEADILVVIMDGRAGLTPLDQEIATLLRDVNKPTFYAINKIDTPQAEPLLADFYQLGKDQLFPISAEHGTGVDELLEAFLPLLPVDPDDGERVPFPRVAVVGRPNVGKSTLINTLFGAERVVVSDIPGTTRDPVDTHIEYQGTPIIFTDTAGIRRRGKIERGIEGYSLARTLKALGRSDIAILILDGVEGATEQDTKIAGLLLKQGRGCVLFINKWDLRQDDPTAQTQFSKELHRRFPFFTFVPTIFGSALKGSSIDPLLSTIQSVMEAFCYRVPTARLNQFLQKALEDNPLPSKRRSPLKSMFMTQVATKPPTFALFVGKSVEVQTFYLRFLENRLRDTFGFEGTPIRILVRQR
ncbi:ribosome biogenesis GTPase Der [Candidatus Nitronereus thalassa]|uniref:GTPase Der n=1 Tax=Candidatus Nitronereus thalassa TaxID=3020898 RepID=A0ABU3K715_9BACT|nr:ribosome biogenesis GTPase Der [Candidatus Nitronereus thalassa]MDT7042183.1 ribosome biogenesis GTPase Der [Candidatus Nitronereus thalassa]